jgi:antitoxin component of MazEF toxin-antitoxin module
VPALRDIHVYTDLVKVVKVRRVGNSNVVSLPRELEARGYKPGTSVLIEELEGGELRILLADQVHERIRGTGRRVVSDHAEALEILAENDPKPPKRRGAKGEPAG